MFANAIHVGPGTILAVFLLTCADAALRTRMVADGTVAAGAGQLVTNGAATVLQVGESSAVENM